MRIPTVAMTLVVAAVLLVACGGEEETTEPSPSTDPGKGGPKVPGEPEVPAVPDPGKATLAASCVECHGIETVTGASKSKEEWAAQVAGCMQGKPLDERAAKELVEHLAKNYGQ